MLIECEPRGADCAAVHLCGFSRACVRFRQLLQVVFLLVRKISLVPVCSFCVRTLGCGVIRLKVCTSRQIYGARGSHANA